MAASPAGRTLLCPYKDPENHEAISQIIRAHSSNTLDIREATLAEIDRLSGRHLYFLDDHLFGDERFAAALLDGMRGMGRLWQAAGTVRSVLRPGLLSYERTAEGYELVFADRVASASATHELGFFEHRPGEH